MSNNIPNNIKIYHIVHVDRLTSIINDGFLYSDAKMRARPGGTSIGMPNLKDTRLHKKLSSHEDLYVGCCVPFYFCPRSVMLYAIYCKNHAEIVYKGGQDNIVHLVASFEKTIKWSHDHHKRWAFTDMNATCSLFNDYNNFTDLHRIDWHAIETWKWKEPEVKNKQNF